MTAPTARRLGRFAPGSPEWHEARRMRLGGSEISAVLGLSPWESPFSLWHRKAGTIGPIEDTPYLEWGRRLEDVVAEKFRETHGITRYLPGGTYVHKKLPWMLANPDRLWRDGTRRELLECKTGSSWAEGWGTPGTDEVPVYYLCQTRWYLGVLGLQRARLAVLLDGNDYREYVIEQDVDDLRTMVDAGREFIASLEDGTPPPIDSSEMTYTATRQLHPDIDPVDVEVPPDMAGEWLVAKAEKKRIEAEERLAKSTLLDAMGTAKNAVVTDPTSGATTRVAYRTARGGGLPYLCADRKAERMFITTETKETAA